MNKKILWGIIAALVIVLLAMLSSKSNNAAPSAPLASAKANVIAVNPNNGKPITVDGWIFCLPRKNPGTECVIGLEDKGNQYYGLADQSGKPVNPMNYTTGVKTTVSGSLVTDNYLQQNYNAAGAIVVNQ